MEVIKRKTGFKYREEIILGHRRIKSPAFPRKIDAKAWKHRMEKEKYSMMANGEDSILFKGNQTFKEYSLNWLNKIVKNDLAPRTSELYEGLLRNHLIPFLGHLKLIEIKEIHGREFVNNLKNKGLSPRGINLRLGLAKTILTKAKKDNFLSRNPFEFISNQRKELKSEVFWTKTEISQFLLKNSGHYLYPLFFVALHTGMRLGELCGLGWDRIDFDLNQISVTRIRDKEGLRETTKTKLKRVIPMAPGVTDLLFDLRLRDASRGNQMVFERPDGEPVDYGHVYRDFKKAQRKAGFTNLIRFHDLRHTFASQFVMNGGNLFDLQKILGHTQINMTMRYTHFSPDHLQKSTQFIDFGMIPPHIPLKKSGENSFSLISRG